MKQYDAIIIGSGQAGNPLAHKLSDLGWKIALIEKEHLGGSCVNYGCTPTKTMIASARLAHYARKANTLGVHTGEIKVNLPEIVARKNEIVAQWRGGQEHHTGKRENIDLHRGHARFTGPHTVEVNGDTLTSEKIFINVGTSPRVLPITGLDDIDYVTNREILDLTTVPEHLVILGGNYLGLEFGQMFARFGAKVTVIEYADRLLAREDEDVAASLQTALEAEDMQFHFGATVSALKKTTAGFTATVENRADKSTFEIDGSHFFMAVGRTPNTADLGLEAAGIETYGPGFIQVNDKLETNVPGVWALGDVKGGAQFTHIAYDDHLIVFDALIHGKQRTTNDRLAPYAMFTDPELGRVGLTEAQARAAGYKIKVGSVPMAWVARAIERDETQGMMKIVINAENDRILGATILGVEGGEVVQVLMALMMADAPYTLFEKSVYIHPTLVEGFFSLMDSVKPVN